MDPGELELAWRRRAAQRREARRHAAARARTAAGTAARVLHDQFGATEVWLFGSVRTGRIHERSDLDLAVRGVPDASFYKALAAACGAAGMTVDLVDLGDCPESLRRAVLQHGERLDV